MNYKLRIRDLREEMSEACYQAGDWPTGVYKLTVPTGGGRLWRA